MNGMREKSMLSVLHDDDDDATSLREGKLKIQTSFTLLKN